MTQPRYELVTGSRFRWYRLVEPYRAQTGITTAKGAMVKGLALDPAGNLTISAGYQWDGPSGPTLATVDGLRASLVHDALYELIRTGRLASHRRAETDELFRRLLVEDGMPRWRARLWYWGVRAFGWRHV